MYIIVFILTHSQITSNIISYINISGYRISDIVRPSTPGARGGWLDSSEHRDCVAEGDDKTGETAQGCMDYVASHRPLVFICENVKNLQSKDKESGKSNLEVLVSKFNHLGYVVRHWVLEASSYGFPQLRERLFLLGVLHSSHPVNQGAEDFEMPVWYVESEVALRGAEVPMLPITDFLVPDSMCFGGPIGVDDEKGGKKDGAKGGKKQDAWQADHLNMYREAKLVWPPEFSAEFEERTGGMPRRVQELINFVEVYAERAETPEPRELTVRDVNMSASWGTTVFGGRTPCLVASSVFWLHSDGSGKYPPLSRVLSGEEALALQGFSHDIQRPVAITKTNKLMTQRNLRDIAGNMFNGGAIMAMCLATVGTVPWQTAVSVRESSRQRDDVEPVDGDGEESKTNDGEECDESDLESDEDTTDGEECSGPEVS